MGLRAGNQHEGRDFSLGVEAVGCLGLVAWGLGLEAGVWGPGAWGVACVWRGVEVWRLGSGNRHM